MDPKATLPTDASQGPTHDADGVDRSLIRESLARTPAERLDLADAYAVEIEALRKNVSDEPFRA